MSYRSTLAPLSVPAGFRLVWYQWAKGRRALGWVDTKEDPTRVIFSEEWSTPDDAVRHLLETEGVDYWTWREGHWHRKICVADLGPHSFRRLVSDYKGIQ